MKMLYKSIKYLCQLGLTIFMGTNLLFADDFIYTPPKQFTLDPKYIALHHPVKTDQLAAQLYFDQGLTQLYTFNNDMAYWSFLNASKIDPQMAMAYWGMALTLSPGYHTNIDPERKKAMDEAIQKAVELSENGLEVESEYISALAQKYANDSNKDPKKLEFEYSQKLKQISQNH